MIPQRGNSGVRAAQGQKNNNRNYTRAIKLKLKLQAIAVPTTSVELILQFYIIFHANCAFRALGVPVTDHTYEDCRLMISAGELTLPMEAGLVEFTKISRKLK